MPNAIYPLLLVGVSILLFAGGMYLLVDGALKLIKEQWNQKRQEPASGNESAGNDQRFRDAA
jgi:predicted DNA repair protein MutK